jgi:PREDICTED: acidic repeat-containing protein isoform 2
MAMDKNYEVLLNASLERYEKMIEKGAVDSEEFSASKLSKIENKINLLIQNSEVKANFLERLNKIRTYIPENVSEETTEKNISQVSPRFFKVPVDFIKKHKASTAAAIFAAVGLTAVTLHGCGNEDKNSEPIIVESTESTENATEEVQKNDTEVQFTEMDSEYVELAESITKGLNDEISKGLEVTEENKGVVSKAYTEYYMLNQVDTLTDEEWANIFPSSNITSEDIMQAKYDLELVDEKRVTVSNQYLDYSLMFNETDSKMLSGAGVALDKVKNATTSVAKKEANAEFMDYITDVFNLESDNQISPYSFRAIDTFRNVYFNAFDELTLHNVINDELEHKVDTASLCNISNNGLNVEDKNINSVQSKVVIATQEKIDTRLQNGWNYANTHELNPYNDIDDIVEYVESHIDLSLYQELPDYEEYLTKITLPASTKSKDDSGISDGKGGHISKSDMQAHGATNKEEYEQAVRDEDAKKSEESKVITDNDGNTISSGSNASEQDAVDNYESEYNKGYEAGSKAYENGGSSTAPSESSSAYKEGYSNGWKDAKKRNENSQTTYIPTNDDDTTTSETTETVDDYTTDPTTPDNNTNDNTTTEFVPIDDGDTTTSETTETVDDYTTDYVPVDETNNQVTTTESSEVEEGYTTEYVPIENSEVQNIEESSETIEEYKEESKGQSSDDISSQLESLKQLRDLILSDTNEVVETKGMKI